MATYIVGDIQGCAKSLDALLGQLPFDPKTDRLLIAGDLVNRGPASLATLEILMALGPCVEVVLGNHDLHLLARAAGIAPARSDDTLDDVLKADELPAILFWLRQQQMVIIEKDFAVVHAGFLPQWRFADIDRWSKKIMQVLDGEAKPEILDRSHPLPRSWQEALALGAQECLRFIMAVMTRIRTLNADGEPDFRYSGAPVDAPEGYCPWYAAPAARWRQEGRRVFFGHWAAHGFAEINAQGVVALDSGCVWGGNLTAYRLEDGQIFAQPLIDTV